MNAAVGAPGLLRGAVDHVVVVLVDHGPECAGHIFDMYAAAADHGAQLFVRERARRMIGEGPGPAILVVDGRPGMTVERVVSVRRDHRVEGHDPLRDAPVEMARLSAAARADEQAAIGFDDLELRLLVSLIVGSLGGAMQRIGVQFAAVQPRDMR